jgi:VanZ family protein
MRTPLLSRLLVLALLMAGTIGFFKRYDRYESCSPELLIDPGFSQGFAYWERNGRGTAQVTDGDVLLLRVDEASAGVAVRQSLPDPGRYRLLRLSGELKTRDIRPGPQFWHKGRLALVSLDGRQRMLPVPHLVADLTGTQSWQTYQAVFQIPAAAQSVRAVVQLIGATGTLAVKNLSLHEVREKADFAPYRHLGMILWVLALLWLGLPWFSRLRPDWPHLATCLTGLGIAVGTLLPLNFKMQLELATGRTLARLLPWWGPAIDQTLKAQMVFSKLGHIVLFALLAMTVRWAYPHQHRLRVGLILLLPAAISEVLQFFVAGRVPAVTDFCLDGAGVLLGLGLLELLRVAKRRLEQPD